MTNCHQLKLKAADRKKYLKDFVSAEKNKSVPFLKTMGMSKTIMKKKPLVFDPNNIANIDKDPLMRESDRGCVLVCASDIENLLTDILESWTKEASGIMKSDWKRLTDYTGLLGTFSSKLEMAKAIGLLDAPLCADINAIRIIRNRAAHGNSDFSLSATENKTIIASMNCNHRRKSEITRYSLKPSKDELKKEEITNESIVKGYGLVRYDKSNFIITVSIIKVQMTGQSQIAEMIIRKIHSMRQEVLQALSEIVSNKEAKK